MQRYSLNLMKNYVGLVSPTQPVATMFVCMSCNSTESRGYTDLLWMCLLQVWKTIFCELFMMLSLLLCCDVFMSTNAQRIKTWLCVILEDLWCCDVFFLAADVGNIKLKHAMFVLYLILCHADSLNWTIIFPFAQMWWSFIRSNSKHPVNQQIQHYTVWK